MRRIMQQNKEQDQKDELEWEQEIAGWRQKRATFAAEMAAKRAAPEADDANSDSDADSGGDNSDDDDDDEKDADMAGAESPTEEEMAGLDKKARKELKKARKKEKKRLKKEKKKAKKKAKKAKKKAKKSAKKERRAERDDIDAAFPRPVRNDPVVRVVRKLWSTTVPTARASIVWMISEFQYKEEIRRFAPDALRRLAKSFQDEQVEVKLQILNLAVKLTLKQLEEQNSGSASVIDPATATAAATAAASAAATAAAAVDADSKAEGATAGEEGAAAAAAAIAERAAAAAEAAIKAAEAEEAAGKAADAATRRDMLPKLLHYILEVARYDMDYDIRDRCRSLRAMVAMAQSGNVDLSASAMAALLADKPIPVVVRAKTSGTDKQSYSERYEFGSLSFSVGHAAIGYSVIPDWPSEQPDPSVRTAASSIANAAKKGASAHRSGNRSSSSDSSGSSDSSDSSDTDSDSDSDDSSDSSSSSSSSSSSESSSSESSSSSSSDDSDNSDDSDDDEDTKSGRQAKAPSTEDLLSLGIGSMSVGGAPSAPSTAAAATIPPPATAGVVAGSSVTPSFTMVTQAGSSCGLTATYTFIRGPSLYGPKVSFLRLSLTNISDASATSINMEVVKLAGDDQGVTPFAEVAEIQPGASEDVDLYINFAGREGRPVRLRLVTDAGSTEGDVVPPLGELVKPLEMTAEDFLTQRGNLGGMQETAGQLDAGGYTAEVLSARVCGVANFAAISLRAKEDGGADALHFACQRLDDNSPVLVTLCVASGGETVDIKANSPDVLLGGQVVEFLKSALK